jgi:enoyl-CoA hydratase/carnithine racemase
MIDVTPHGEISIIRLDRPAKRNAQTPVMLANLVGAVERAASARAIVLSGVGEVFCAGFDLTLCRDDERALGKLLTGLSRAVLALRSAPCPVVVSAHGAAIAGGCALAAAGDIVVTNAGAKLGYPVVRLGISPAVNAPALRAAIGAGAARTRALDPGLVDGREACRVGLAHVCVEEAGACEAEAIRIAEGLAAKPRHALGYTKRWLGELDGTLDEQGWEKALAVSMSLVNSAEQTERLAAVWAEKKG